VLGFTGAISATLMVKVWMGCDSHGDRDTAGGACDRHVAWLLGCISQSSRFHRDLASYLAFRGLIIGITGGQTVGLNSYGNQVMPTH